MGGKKMFTRGKIVFREMSLKHIEKMYIIIKIYIIIKNNTHELHELEVHWVRSSKLIIADRIILAVLVSFALSSGSILGLNVPGVLFGGTRKDTASSFNNPTQRHRLLYGSHLQSIMSPPFYAEYASNFNTLASIFVCLPAFFSVSLSTLAFCAFLRLKRDIIFHSASWTLTQRRHTGTEFS